MRTTRITRRQLCHMRAHELRADFRRLSVGEMLWVTTHDDATLIEGPAGRRVSQRRIRRCAHAVGRYVWFPRNDSALFERYQRRFLQRPDAILAVVTRMASSRNGAPSNDFGSAEEI
jgi:hypothetical protein